MMVFVVFRKIMMIIIMSNVFSLKPEAVKVLKFRAVLCVCVGNKMS